MVSCEGQQDTIHEQYVLEVVYDALAIQKVHCCPQKIPVQRLGEAETAGAAGHIGYGNDLLEGYDLYRGHDDDDVDMAGRHGAEEEGDHYQGPHSTLHEVRLLLFILGLGGWGLWYLLHI